jgi:hypothetical protein
LATVFGLTSASRARTAVGALLRWNSRRMRAVVRAFGWRLGGTDFVAGNSSCHTMRQRRRDRHSPRHQARHSSLRRGLLRVYAAVHRREGWRFGGDPNSDFVVFTFTLISNFIYLLRVRSPVDLLNLKEGAP